LKVSIEGYAVHFRTPDNPEALIMDFHSYLSDDRTQLASTVYWHMDDLTDGCAAQYKCANALYYQSLLAHKDRIVVGRNISEAGPPVLCTINALDLSVSSTVSPRTNTMDPTLMLIKSLKIIGSPTVISIKNTMESFNLQKYWTKNDLSSFGLLFLCLCW